jgi:predicted enzyme related to lactoylglutathione lyase
MNPIQAHFLGVELYFENLDRAKTFYTDILGLEIAEDAPGHHAKFQSDAGFVCLEKKGVESYPSKDKAVLFFAVPDLNSAIDAMGREKIVHSEPTWAVLHDPEGHNVLLLQQGS